MIDSIEWTPKARAVLNAAAELFYDRGIHAVGVDTVAERAGVTKKTLYDRFGSKDRLIVAYLAERDRSWRAFLNETLAQPDPSPVLQLRAVFNAAAVWSRNSGPKGCAMVNGHAEISDPAHPAYRGIVGQKHWMRSMFIDLASAAGAPDPRSLGEQIMLLHEGAVVVAGMKGMDDAFARAADAVMALVAVNLPESESTALGRS